MKRLGENQESVLRCLREHGYWHAACGWLWDTPSGTTRILESLVRRGLVVRVDGTRPVYWPKEDTNA